MEWALQETHFNDKSECKYPIAAAETLFLGWSNKWSIKVIDVNEDLGQRLWSSQWFSFWD